jgi:hypothetical protein
VNVEQDLRARPEGSQAELWRELQRILAEWRAAERCLATSQPGSAEHARAAADVSRLRREYHRTFALAHER